MGRHNQVGGFQDICTEFGLDVPRDVLLTEAPPRVEERRLDPLLLYLEDLDSGFTVANHVNDYR